VKQQTQCIHQDTLIILKTLYQYDALHTTSRDVTTYNLTIKELTQAIKRISLTLNYIVCMADNELEMTLKTSNLSETDINKFSEVDISARNSATIRTWRQKKVPQCILETNMYVLSQHILQLYTISCNSAEQVEDRQLQIIQSRTSSLSLFAVYFQRSKSAHLVVAFHY